MGFGLRLTVIFSSGPDDFGRGLSFRNLRGSARIVSVVIRPPVNDCVLREMGGLRGGLVGFFGYAYLFPKIPHDRSWIVVASLYGRTFYGKIAVAVSPKRVSESTSEHCERSEALDFLLFSTGFFNNLALPLQLRMRLLQSSSKKAYPLILKRFVFSDLAS